MEKFYDDGHILVESTRFVVGNKTFPINSISSVEPKEIRIQPKYHEELVEDSYIIPAKNEWLTYVNVVIAIVLFAIAVTLFMVEGFLAGMAGLFASFFLTPAIVWVIELFYDYEEKKVIPAKYKTVATPVPSDYTVSIVTSAGEQETFRSSNKEKIIDITEAINNAIISRG